MKSRLRQWSGPPLRSSAMHLAGSAAGCALQVLFLGGGKDPVLAGSDPTLRGSLPANFAALVHRRAQHSFMQVLPPPLRRPQRTIFKSPEGSTVMPLLKPPTPKPERVNLHVRVEKSFLELVELYAEFIGASREYVVTESVNRLLKRDHDFQGWLRQQNHSRGEKPAQPRATTA